MSQQFGWDAAKAALNLKKHRIGFDEALTVFADPLTRIFDDPDHSADEERARSATARERNTYEENTNTSQEP